MPANRFQFVDLFSGAGGMSYGFHRHPLFEVIGAVDAEKGKPSSGSGSLQCNQTYRKNIGIEPRAADLSELDPQELRSLIGLGRGDSIDVLSACPPCTGFSRANPQNHVRDDERNSLVRKSAEFAIALGAKVVVMENARELLRGNFTDHFAWFRQRMESAGYRVEGRNHFLTRFGLPQIRERAVVVATRSDLVPRSLDDLWDGFRVAAPATTVATTFRRISRSASGRYIYPDFSSEIVKRRLAAIPRDGGSWIDLLPRPDADELLTDSMKRLVAQRKFGSYPDVYGRMAWNKPAPTIKRECSHIGNGRYAHPEEDRLCSVREIAALQGFPDDFEFEGAAVSNLYRHIGDAVPPLVSHQLAHVVAWTLTGRRPELTSTILPGTNLRTGDLVPSTELELAHA